MGWEEAEREQKGRRGKQRKRLYRPVVSNKMRFVIIDVKLECREIREWMNECLKMFPVRNQMEQNGTEAKRSEENGLDVVENEGN